MIDKLKSVGIGALGLICILAYHPSFMGTWAVITGLCFAGIGVVPVGMLAALFHGMWARLAELIVLIVLTFGSRFFAAWLAAKSEEADQAIYFRVESDGV
jgi:hypothetical protein